MSLSWDQPRCCQRKFKIHWVDTNLLSTYKVQELLLVLWVKKA